MGDFSKIIWTENQQTLDLNSTLDQTNLTEVGRTFNPPTAGYTLFSTENGTFFRINPMTGHIARLSKFKKIEIILHIFF